MSILRRQPLISFFVFTYALTWSAVPFGIFFTPGPLIAAFIVVMLTQGRSGLREWGSRLIRWRVGWLWYVIAVAVPMAVHALTVGINLALGAGRPSPSQLAPASMVMIFAVRLINPMDGPMAEEPGWRAFAQPALQRGHSPLTATAILSLLVASWHLPLWLLPQFGATPVDIGSDVLGTIAVTFWYAWLFNHSAGSALLTLIAHAIEGVVHPQLFWSDATVAARTTWLYSGVWSAVAIALVVFDQKFWRNAEQGKSTTTQPDPILEEATKTSERSTASLRGKGRADRNHNPLAPDAAGRPALRRILRASEVVFTLTPRRSARRPRWRRRRWPCGAEPDDVSAPR